MLKKLFKCFRKPTAAEHRAKMLDAAQLEYYAATQRARAWAAAADGHKRFIADLQKESRGDA